jgi:nanoRNase/pAp phosphatase (c-di-AMP/oligoRNAs hydrolase)
VFKLVKIVVNYALRFVDGQNNRMIYGTSRPCGVQKFHIVLRHHLSKSVDEDFGWHTPSHGQPPAKAASH